jgi:hypothetical protein
VATNEGNRGPGTVVAAAAMSLAVYAALAVSGDLRSRPAVYVVGHLVLVALMLFVWKATGRSGRRAWRVVLVSAAAFRLVMATAPPTLSDDIYRYVWDGSVQAAGHHPYRYAPADPERAEFRSLPVTARIHDPETVTSEAPLAELCFAGLAAAKLGVTGFKLAIALADLGVVAAMIGLLNAYGAPRERAVLYAWNPLAIVETAGSGHIEPLGVALVILCVMALTRGRPVAAAAALGAAIQAKLVPVLLLPGFARRLRTHAVLVLAVVVLALGAVYALRGPALGAGLLPTVQRFEHGSIVYPAIESLYERLDPAPALRGAIAWAQSRWGSADTRVWDALNRMAGPEELARLTVLAVLLGWALAQSARARITPLREARLVLGAAILLAPACHPWTVLWALPLAAAEGAYAWVLLAALVPLQYLAGEGDVPWPLRFAILTPPIVWMAWDSIRSVRAARAAPDAVGTRAAAV